MKRVSAMMMVVGVSAAFLSPAATAQKTENDQANDARSSKQSDDHKDKTTLAKKDGQDSDQAVVVDKTGAKQVIRTPVSASGLGRVHPATDDKKNKSEK